MGGQRLKNSLTVSLVYPWFLASRTCAKIKDFYENFGNRKSIYSLLSSEKTGYFARFHIA